MPERSLPGIVADRSMRRLMAGRATLETVVIRAAFALYVVFALKLVLFSRSPGSERSFNVVPFAGISHYLSRGSPGVTVFAFANIAGNVLLFVPLGSDLSVLTKWTATRTMLVVASASATVEILQGLFALGASDIDDVILNCLGGLLGIQVFHLLRVIVHGHGRARTVVAVLSAVAVPVLFYALFVIRLRM